MRLGFDIDGVLYPWQEVAYIQAVDDHKDFGYSFEDFWRKGIDDTLPKLYMKNLVRNPLLLEIKIPNPELIEMLNRLASKWDIEYISSRPEELFRVTSRYLRKYKFPEADTLILSDTIITDIRLANFDYYIEDRSDIANQLAKFTKVILVSRPYNKGDLLDNSIIRIDNILDLERILI